MKAGPHRKGIEDGTVCMDFDVHILTRYEAKSKTFNFWGGGGSVSSFMGFPSGSEVKNLPVGLGDSRYASSIPESRSSPGGGHGSPLQYSCLENPMARGAWQATVHRVTKSPTQLK